MFSQRHRKTFLEITLTKFAASASDAGASPSESRLASTTLSAIPTEAEMFDLGAEFAEEVYGGSWDREGGAVFEETIKVSQEGQEHHVVLQVHSGMVQAEA